MTTSLHLKAMKKRLTSRPGLRGCCSVLGKSDSHVFVMPNKAVSCQLGGAMGLEEGWVKTTVSHDSNGRKDNYWYSPHNHRLRSKVEYERYLDCLKVANGNYSKAYELLK